MGGFIIENFISQPPFHSQTENIQVALPEESRSEGEVGFKAYKNYFTAGAHWFIIIFLILVNVAAQVNKDISFDLCPMYTAFILLLFLIRVLRYLFQRIGS